MACSGCPSKSMGNCMSCKENSRRFQQEKQERKDKIWAILSLSLVAIGTVVAIVASYINF